MQQQASLSEHRTCTRCVLDSSVPGIQFSEQGVCNHCALYDRLQSRYALDEKAKRKFEHLLAAIKASGRNKQHDCVIGLSGGTDSSYCVYMAKKLGLRPLVVHFDNGWVSEPARQNIEKIVHALQVDLRVVRHEWAELKEYYLAGLKASVPDICMACLVGISSSLYRVAAEESIRYILLGTSFRTEGLTPARWGYMDGRYFDDVVRLFGGPGARLKTFNRTHLFDLFRYIMFKRIRTVQLPLYIPYRDQEIRKLLTSELGWQYGGKHHFDCRFKPFLSFIHAHKFSIDYRKIPMSALVRAGEVTRQDALAALAANAKADASAEVAYVLNQLGMTPGELRTLLEERPRNFLDYRNYHSFLRFFAPVAKVLGKLHLVPETLYERYFKLV